MRAPRFLPAVALLVVLAGCSAAPSDTPDDEAAPPVDHTVQATVDGEWVLTRTVTASDDATNPAHAVGTVSTRNVLFGDITCDDGPCAGGVLSGPTTVTRDATTFSSSGNLLSYELSGYLHCLRQDTGAVLVANGYSFTTSTELHVVSNDPANDAVAASLEGTMTYSDSLTDEAIEAGCAREPLTSTTEYSVTAVRAAAPAVPAA